MCSERVFVIVDTCSFAFNYLTCFIFRGSGADISLPLDIPILLQTSLVLFILLFFSSLRVPLLLLLFGGDVNATSPACHRLPEYLLLLIRFALLSFERGRTTLNTRVDNGDGEKNVVRFASVPVCATRTRRTFSWQ